MNTKLLSFKREAHPYKLTLMLDPKIANILKKYSKDYNLTMSCIVENLIYGNLRGESHGTKTL